MNSNSTNWVTARKKEGSKVVAQHQRFTVFHVAETIDFAEDVRAVRTEFGGERTRSLRIVAVDNETAEIVAVGEVGGEMEVFREAVRKTACTWEHRLGGGPRSLEVGAL
jgi:hypothetical protein